MCQSEIDAIRALLSSRPRPLGWTERRRRLDEIGSYWPASHDVEFESVDVDGVSGEWSIVRGSDVSRTLLYLHGGGYCSGSIVSVADPYVPVGMARTDPRISVLYADLKGLPCSSRWVRQRRCLTTQRALRRLQGCRGGRGAGDTGNLAAMIHAWHLWNAHLEPGRQALASAGAFIRRHL